MAEFGGSNELERRLRALLQTERLYCFDRPNGNSAIWIQETLSDDQAWQLGQVLLEGHQVEELQMHNCIELTATGDYQPLLDFIQNDTVLREVRYIKRYIETDEVTSRFFRAVSHSKSIQTLAIFEYHHRVPTETLLDLLHTNTSISSLNIWKYGPCRNVQVIERDARAIEAAFVRNTSVTRLKLMNAHSTLFAGIIRAMKRSQNIEIVDIVDITDDTFEELAQALPFFKGLRRLSCMREWTVPLDATMMEAFNRNGSLVQVTLASPSHQLDPLLQQYLERNRGIQRTLASPGTVPDNLIPLICAAAAETSLGLDLIFEIVKAKAHLFQDLPGEENRSNDSVPLPRQVRSNETQNNNTVKCSMCCLM